MLVPLEEAVRETCGGKAATLGALRRAGLLVPDGFVVPFDVYRTATGHDALLDALARGLTRLGSPFVAVRSSAAGEDTAEASAAGMYESVLAVREPDDVAHAVRTCWASLHSPRAVDYRGHVDAGQRSGEDAMAVLVHRLVDAEVSGVMFTPSAPGGETEIEASWGLGASVVAGTVTPDAYRVGADGTVVRAVGDKATRLDRTGGRLVARDVPHEERRASTLDDAAAVGLARLGQRVADVLGGPQDVEWGLAEGRLWILQARPVTAPLPGAPLTSRASSRGLRGTLHGTPGSTGAATGPARVVRGPADFSRVRPGDVLVCPFTDPAWTPLLRLAAGVVTETGGVLSHAAIVARERRIPAVLGIVGVTRRIADGCMVTVDGASGTITVAETSTAAVADPAPGS